MKRYSLEIWLTHTRAAGNAPDITADFCARTICEALLESDGFAARVIEAARIEADPVEIRIREVLA